MNLLKATVIALLNIAIFNMVTGDGWQTLPQCPDPTVTKTSKAVITRVGPDTIYAFIGQIGTATSIQRYVTGLDTWLTAIPTSGPRKKSSHMAWDSVANKIHFLYQKQTDNKWQHSVLNRLTYYPYYQWQNAPKPLIIRGGCASCNDMVWVRYNGISYLYLLRNFAGVNYNFVRYNCNSQTWEQKASMPQQPITGAAMCWNERNDSNSYIYAFSGTNTSNSPPPRAFYRYKVAKDSWQGMSGPGSYTSAGALAYRKKTGGDLIYAFIRVDKNYFKQYDVLTNTWDSLASTPYALKHGDALVYIPRDTLVFAFRGGDNKDFWRYVPSATDEGGEEKETTVEDNDPEPDPEDPGWSHDGEWVIFSKLEMTEDSTNEFYRLYRCRPDGTEETAVISDANNYFESQMSPDSNLITYIINDQLGIMNMDDLSKQILDGDICCHPSWSPDGDWITYVKWSFEDQNYKVYIVHPDGSGKTSLTDTSSNFHPQFSPDGQYIAYQKDFGDYSAIYKVSVQNPEEEAITTDQVDYGMPQWTTEGDAIICMKPDEYNFYQLCKVSVGTSEEVMLTNEACDHIYPQISLSGEYVVYVKINPDSSGSQICRKPVTGGNEEVLTDYGTLKEDPNWSPASDLIVYVESGDNSDEGRRIKVISSLPITESKHYDFLPVGRLSLAPNPFSKSICFTYTAASLPEKLDKFNLKIYDAGGRLTRTLKVKSVDGNKVTYIWNGDDNDGRKLANGIYFGKLQVGKSKILRKITFLGRWRCPLTKTYANNII